MLRSLKVFFFALLASMMLVSPLLAQDKTVDRSKLTREQTIKQLAKDLAALQHIVEKATKALGKEKVICPDPFASDQNAEQELLFDKAVRLQRDGYILKNYVKKSVSHSYVGTGLRLGYLDEFGIIKVVIGSVPGSPAARTEFFDQPYIIFELDGKDVFWDSMKDLRQAIIGNGKPGSGVTLTLQRADGGRDYVRFLERKRITVTSPVSCMRFVK